MNATVRIDRSNRIVLSRDLLRAAGIAAGQQFKVFATPGRIVLQVESTSCGKLAQRGKLKVWSGKVPNTPLAEAIEQMRH